MLRRCYLETKSELVENKRKGKTRRLSRMSGQVEKQMEEGANLWHAARVAQEKEL